MMFITFLRVFSYLCKRLKRALFLSDVGIQIDFEAVYYVCHPYYDVILTESIDNQGTGYYFNKSRLYYKD